MYVTFLFMFQNSCLFFEQNIKDKILTGFGIPVVSVHPIYSMQGFAVGLQSIIIIFCYPKVYSEQPFPFHKRGILFRIVKQLL